MPDRHGKYIVFCANYEHMQTMIDKAGEWFSQLDREPHIYTAYSDDPDTSRAFAEFKADGSEHLKLLYCIDMLNEGVHVDDVNGVILLRPTVSPIIYKQQIGRAMSASNKANSVIFDIVLNIENLYSIDSVKEEMRAAISYYRFLGEDKYIVNARFTITDEVHGCLEIFERLNETLSASWDLMYLAVKKYYDENGDIDIPKRYITPDGLSLGAWLDTQRRVYTGKIAGILTDEQVQKLDELGMRWASVKEIAWEKYYNAAKSYYSEHGNLLVPYSNELYEGVRLGKWIAQLRFYRKNKVKNSYTTEEHIKALDEIGMVWAVPDYLWEQNFYAAMQYFRGNGNLDAPSSYATPDGLRLGSWLAKQRKLHNSPTEAQHLTDEQTRRLEEIGMIWMPKNTAAWDFAYEAACEYKKKYGNLDVPVAYVAQNGTKLGKWIRVQRDKYGNRLSEARTAKLNAIGMVWNKPDPWNAKFELVKQYFTEHGDVNMPADYVVDGVWLARWLSEQIKRMNGKSKKSLTDRQVELLKSVGIRKNVSRYDLSWEENLAEVRKYLDKYGNLDIPKKYIGANGKDINLWLKRQRAAQKNGKLSQDHITQLNKIGMTWSA